MVCKIPGIGTPVVERTRESKSHLSPPYVKVSCAAFVVSSGKYLFRIRGRKGGSCAIPFMG